MQYTETLTWNDAEIDVHYTFEKGYEAKIYGAPEDCYPGCDDEFEIECIIYDGKNVTALFNVDDMIEIEERILSKEADYD